MKTSKCVRISVSRESAAIYDLRLQAYIRAPEFELLQPETLQWRRADENGIVLSAYEVSGEPLATTSVTIVPNKRAAEEIMECRWIGGEELFPAMLLGKGATQKHLHKGGLHSVIRYYLLKCAEQLPFKSVLGIVYESAPRTNLMRKIGYELVKPQHWWYSDLRPLKPTLIGILSRAKFSSAIQLLFEEFQEVIREYPLEETALKERLHRLFPWHSGRYADLITSSSGRITMPCPDREENHSLTPYLVKNDHGKLCLPAANDTLSGALTREKVVCEISSSIAAPYNDQVAVQGKDIDGVYFEKSKTGVKLKVNIDGNLDGIDHPLAAVLPAIDGKHEFVHTDFCDKGKFHYLDSRLEGPVLFHVKADKEVALKQRESLFRYLSRTVSHKSEEENGGIGKRLIEPGVGRTFLVDLLRLRNKVHYKDFSATGIGLTPYSMNGFVAVGRIPDGKVALIRAEHRKNIADKLNAIGCRASKVVAIIEMDTEQVQMLDGTFSARAIMIRAFRNVLRVKQIDPIAGFYHSLQHSALVSSIIIEDMACFLGYNTCAPDYRQVDKLSRAGADLESFSAAADDFFKIVKPGFSYSVTRAQHYRQQIIKKYCASIFDLARERVAAETGGPLTVKEYLEWFAGCFGKQMRLVKEHGFLHDYHHPGIGRYTRDWIYTLVEHNITLSAEFADLETGVFVHAPEEEIRNNLQLTKEDVLLLRKKFADFHTTDYVKARRIIQSLAYAAACGGLIDNKHVPGIITCFEHHYKYN
jgi:hypothetical protein